MAKIQRRKPEGVRWAKLSELDRRIKVGSRTFNKLPYRIQQLTAWRGDHAVAGSHKPVRRFARAKGVKPSSNITLGTKISFVQARSKRGR